MSESRTDAYGYNDRKELTNAVKNATLNEYTYQYDDIGNRLTSLDLGEAREYTANNLNQYVNVAEGVGDFIPQFDLDGNQTLVKTSTDVWQVTYNGENRPVLWSSGSTNITMKFDRIGRSVEYVESVDGVTNRIHRFVYDGYLCIQRLDGAANNAVDLAFGWDPIEPVATRPLWMQRVSGTYIFFYFHDGNKNVSDLVSYQSARGVPAHYEYAPFGTVTASTTNTVFTSFNVSEVNPYRFSSEYADDALGLMSYNFRHYEPVVGRWCNKDVASEFSYLFVENNSIVHTDFLGLVGLSKSIKFYKKQRYRFQAQKIVCGKRFDPVSGKCKCVAPCSWENIEGPEENDFIIVTLTETYHNGLTGSQIAAGIAEEVGDYLGDKFKGSIEDLLVKWLVGHGFPNIPFGDEISALGDSKYVGYVLGDTIEYEGVYYLSHTTSRSYEDSRDVPSEFHMKVPSCDREGELETIGRKIGKPFWTNERGY